MLLLKDRVSILGFSFHSKVKIFCCTISAVYRSNNPYICFSSHFCFVLFNAFQFYHMLPLLLLAIIIFLSSLFFVHCLSTCIYNFPSLQVLWCFPNLVVQFFPLFVFLTFYFQHNTFYFQHNTFFNSKFHSYILAVYFYCPYQSFLFLLKISQYHPYKVISFPVI